jgi:hypothetical protein
MLNNYSTHLHTPEPDSQPPQSENYLSPKNITVLVNCKKLNNTIVGSWDRYRDVGHGSVSSPPISSPDYFFSPLRSFGCSPSSAMNPWIGTSPRALRQLHYTAAADGPREGRSEIELAHVPHQRKKA